MFHDTIKSIDAERKTVTGSGRANQYYLDNQLAEIIQRLDQHKKWLLLAYAEVLEKT
jgi:hypothetical protein